MWLDDRGRGDGTGVVTLSQLLRLKNSDDLPKGIRSADGRLASLLQEMNDHKLIAEIFPATVSRPSQAEEVITIRASLTSGDGAGSVSGPFLGVVELQRFRV